MPHARRPTTATSMSPCCQVVLGLGAIQRPFPGSGATFSLSRTVAGSHTLGVVANSSTPALKAFTTSPALCSINGGAPSSTCALPFVDSGLLVTIPTQTSGVTGSFSVAAVKKSDNTKLCIPAFANVTRNVKFYSGYSNPATGSMTLAVNGVAIGTSLATATTVALAFDATGTASNIPLNYADAGQLTLNAGYDGSTATGDAALAMTGSATFPVVPYKLCVDSPDASWELCGDAGQCPEPGNCGIFKTAGSSFKLRVSARRRVARSRMPAPCRPRRIISRAPFRWVPRYLPPLAGRMAR